MYTILELKRIWRLGNRMVSRLAHAPRLPAAAERRRLLRPGLHRDSTELQQAGPLGRLRRRFLLERPRLLRRERVRLPEVAE